MCPVFFFFFACLYSIPLELVCCLVYKNPQSDTDSGIVLLMHVCLDHPKEGCKRRF